MSDFTHLHCHSYFSLLDGLSSIKGMVSCASDLGYKSLALTDHGSCAGLFQFQKTCKEKGIKPILGMEGYICNDRSIKDKESGNKSHHIILLAKNKIGYKNLINLSSIGYLDGFYYKPRIDFKDLEAHREGLIVSTACAGGEIPSLLFEDNEAKATELANKYKEVFGKDFYLEMMVHDYINDKAMEDKEKKIATKIYGLGKKLDIKVIATQDSHYTRKEDWEAHDVLLSIQTLDHIKNPKRISFGSSDFYIKPYEQMLERYKKIPNVLLNTMEISEKVESDIISGSEDLLPDFKLPEGFNNEEEYLKSLVKNGMEQKGLMGRKSYKERIRYEMSVIIKCKYTKYFLILWDIVNFARSQKIAVGCGRGSAVSSLVLYVLDIIKIDPLKYDLIFERFLNPDRISPPDVDMDFDYDRREEVYNYIIRKYGSEYCCQIGTYNKFKARAVIRSSAKAMDIGNDWEIYNTKKARSPNEKVEMTKNSLDLADRISKNIPFKPDMTLEKALKESKDFREIIHKFPNLLQVARRIEGTVSSGGVHPAGILLCKYPVIDIVPLRAATKEGIRVISSQFDGGEVEKIGLLKFDLLALKTLTVIDKTLKMVKGKYGKDIDIDKLEPNDPKVFAMLNGKDPQKNTLGVFQFESPKISKLLADIRVDTFEDMIVANALYRPGPLGAGMDDMYCNYKHGKAKIEYLHPKMGEVLKDTYGIMCFDGSQNIYTEKNTISIENIKGQKIYNIKNNKIALNNAIGNKSFVTGKKEIYKYTLSNGFEIKCTKNHQFKLLNGSYENIDDIYNNNEVIPYFCPEKNTFKDGLSSELDCKFYYLIGLLIGDGYLSSSSPVLCLGNKKNNAKKISNIFKEIYPDGKAVLFWSCRSWYLRFMFPLNNNKWGNRKSNALTQWFRDKSLNVSGKDKRFPMNDIISDRKLCLAFLAGYLDSDGCLSSDISFTSGNEDLLKDTTYVLWKMGYRSYKCHHWIHVCESKQLYEELSPFLFKTSKNKRLSDGARVKLSCNVISKAIQDDIRLNNISQRQYCKINNLNRGSIMRIIAKKIPFCNYHTVKNIMDSIKLNINSCACLWIKKREYIGKKNVYDISMPSNTEHNFFIEPGIVAHNCFQEDFMRISQQLAGFSGGQSDTLRKSVGKKDIALLNSMKQLFIDGCVGNNIAADIARKIFEQIEYFGGYGFNRSHSCAYAFTAYQTAWLKVYYPLEFMCSLLTSEINNSDKNEKLEMYIAAAEKMEITCAEPDINKSGLEFKVVQHTFKNDEKRNGLIKPLTMLNGVGAKAVVNIVANQPYKNMEDFVRKTDGRVVNTKVFSTLVNAGCMDNSWNVPREKLLSDYADIKLKLEKEKKLKQREQKKLEKEKQEYGEGSIFDNDGVKNINI